MAESDQETVKGTLCNFFSHLVVKFYFAFKRIMLSSASRFQMCIATCWNYGKRYASTRFALRPPPVGRRAGAEQGAHRAHIWRKFFRSGALFTLVWTYSCVQLGLQNVSVPASKKSPGFSSSSSSEEEEEEEEETSSSSKKSIGP